MISVCTTSKLSCYCYCYCYCVQRTVNVKKSLLRLQQKRNIEIYVYRLSLSCITQSRQTADINERDHWLPTQRGKEDIWFSSVWRTSWECPKSPKSTPLYPPLPPCPTSFALYPLHPPHFPYNYNYTHTLNHFLPDLQQVAESELSPAAGSGRAIAITKEEGVTKRVLTENLPQLHLLDRAWFSPVYWFIAPMKYQQACGQRW